MPAAFGYAFVAAVRGHNPQYFATLCKNRREVALHTYSRRRLSQEYEYRRDFRGNSGMSKRKLPKRSLRFGEAEWPSEPMRGASRMSAQKIQKNSPDPRVGQGKFVLRRYHLQSLHPVIGVFRRRHKLPEWRADRKAATL
ncbi:MAG: hypothetical protein WDN06_03710 [Asticcacaulis sp.]